MGGRRSDRQIVIQKYGGKSISNLEQIRSAAQRIVAVKERGEDVVVVVSAMGKTTDELLELAYQAHPDPPARELDALVSVGEQISSSLLAMILSDMGYPSVSLLGYQAGILTDENYTNARIKAIDTGQIYQHLEEGKIPVVAGFQGFNSKGEITTMGRGASDLTAVALAAALDAQRCEIYTDVDGVFTCDPALLSESTKLDYISYPEMLELSANGAHLMQTRAVEMARKYGVPIYVANSFSQTPGTWIVSENMLEEIVVTGISVDSEVAEIIARYSGTGNSEHFLAIFQELATANINLNIVVQSSAPNGIREVSFLVKEDDLERVGQQLRKLQSYMRDLNYTTDVEVAKVAMVGSGIASTPGTALRMFKTLANNKIPIKGIVTSEIKMICIIPQRCIKTAVSSLHQEFELGKLKRKKIA